MAYLAELCATAQANLFVSYATGGADWYPDHLSFMFSQAQSRPNGTAHGPLGAARNSQRCFSNPTAADIITGVRWKCSATRGFGNIEIRSVIETLAPLNLYRAAHGDPPFMKQGGRTLTIDPFIEDPL